MAQHTWWNVPSEARIDPPSQDECTRSAGLDAAAVAKHIEVSPRTLARTPTETKLTNLELHRSKERLQLVLQAIREALREGRAARHDNIADEVGMQVGVDLHQSVGDEAVQGLQVRVGMRGDGRGRGGEGELGELQDGRRQGSASEGRYGPSEGVRRTSLGRKRCGLNMISGMLIRSRP